MNSKIKIYNLKVTIDKELNTFSHEPKPARGKRANNQQDGQKKTPTLGLNINSSTTIRIY